MVTGAAVGVGVTVASDDGVDVAPGDGADVAPGDGVPVTTVLVSALVRITALSSSFADSPIRLRVSPHVRTRRSARENPRTQFEFRGGLDPVAGLVIQFARHADHDIIALGDNFGFADAGGIHPLANNRHGLI